MRGSIKQRVALWYAFSFLAILVLVAALLLAAGDRLILQEAKTKLMEITDRAVMDVRIEDGEMSIDSDIVYYSDGVYVSLVRPDGTVISGLGAERVSGISFEANTIRRVEGEASAAGGRSFFYIYDRLIENVAVGNVWVRGVTSARLTDIAPSVMKMFVGFVVALPLLFFLTLVGGRAVTRQAFLPLNQIVDTAEEIRSGGDMSRRIGIGSREDSDEIRRTAAVFDEMLDQIEKNFQMEKQFTNDASHELRTPIAVILAQSEYALENRNDPGEVEESLKEIHSQAETMSSLVSQLLAITRADRGIRQLKPAPVDLSLLGEEAAERWRPAAASHGIGIEIRAEEACYLSGDETFLGRVLDNLIDNAVKYGRPGGHIRIDIAKEPAGDGAGTRIILKVSDDGIGIREENLPWIWERFYRVSRTRPGDMTGAAITPEDEARSMGLGLSMVKWIVEEHGGEIRVQSRWQEGTVFTACFDAMEEE